MANGFANRILWVCAKRSKCLPDGGEMHTVNVAPLVNRFMRAGAFGISCETICRDENARSLWHKVYPSLSEGKAGLLGAATSRAEAQVMRLAVVYAILDESPLVRLEHLQAALALWDYCERSAKYIFGSALGDPTADDILKALRESPKGMDRTAIRELFFRNKSAEEIGNALQTLLEGGLARRRSKRLPDDRGKFGLLLRSGYAINAINAESQGRRHRIMSMSRRQREFAAIEAHEAGTPWADFGPP